MQVEDIFQVILVINLRIKCGISMLEGCIFAPEFAENVHVCQSYYTPDTHLSKFP